MKFITVDLETYGHKHKKRFCNPLCADHYVVANAYKFSGKKAEVDYRREGIPVDTFFDNIDLDSVGLMIGQNFRFDLLWFWKNEKFQTWLDNGGQIWDTLTCEYLLRGQQGVAHGKRTPETSLSLDALATKYGGTLKDEEVKDVWSTGGTVLDIPVDQLIEYAKYDVINTEIVFRGQLKAAKEKGMLDLLKVHNNHILATVEMEFNGMCFDVERAKSLLEELTHKSDKIKENLAQALKSNNLWPQDLIEFNLGSPKQLSTLIFGGSKSVTVKEDVLNDQGEVVRFKSGKRAGEVKQRNVVRDIMIPGLNEKFREEWRTDSGGQGTKEEVLEDLVKRTTQDVTKDVVGMILEYRAINKTISTYLYKESKKGDKGLIPLVHEDGCIHTEYSTVGTETGRMASSNPNVQNLPIDIAELIVSRWGDEGQIVELDFSQIEVVIQAYNSQCAQMMEDIKNGIDFHCLRLSYVEDMDYDEVYDLCQKSDEWKKKRKNTKPISFKKAYGAHPKSIAHAANVPLEVVEKVFDKEDLRYPEIKAYYDDILEHLDNHSVAGEELAKIKTGPKQYTMDPEYREITAQYSSALGKIYTFKKKAIKTSRGVFEYWPGPDVMNYPIQGTAADIFFMQIARVFRFLKQHRDKALMINEVHDSCILDVKKKHLDFIVPKVKAIMVDVNGGMQKCFGMEFNAPIDVDAGHGDNWRAAK